MPKSRMRLVRLLRKLSITNIEEPFESAQFFAKNAPRQCLQKAQRFSTP
jgi:hypothetical protein